jgi:PAS domain S-box
MDDERLRFIVSAAGLGLWDLDPVNKTVHWDEQCRRLHGIDTNTDEIPYDDVMKYIHPDDRDVVNAAVSRALSPGNKSEYSIEYRVPTADGNTRWLHAQGTVFFDDEGKPHRFSGATRDVTATVTDHKRMQAAETHLNVAIDAAGLGTFQVSYATGKLTYTPELARILTGDATDGVDRETFIKYLHPADTQKRARAYDVLKKTGTLAYTARFIWNDGSIHHVKVTGQNILGADGTPTSFAGVLQDVTDDTELAVQQQKLLSLVSKSHDMMAVANMSNQVNYLNDAGKELLGIPDTFDITLLNTRDFYLGQEYTRIMRTITQAMDTEGQWRGMIKLRHFVTGEEIPCLADYQLITDRNTGQAIGKSATMRDMRPEIQAREAMLNSEQRFRNLVLDSPMAVAIMRDKNMVIEVANKAILRAWGQPASVIGKPLLEGIPELKNQEFPQLLEAVYNSGVPYYGTEAKATVQDNGKDIDRYYNFVYTPVREPDGNVSGVMVIAIEVTDTVRARKSIEEMKANLESAISLAELGTWSYDVIGDQITFSERAYDWLGLQPGASLEDVLNTVHAEDREHVTRALGSAMIADGDHSYEAEYRVINTHTGYTRTLHALGKAYFNEKREPYRIAGIAQDITLQRDIENELKRQVSMQTQSLQDANIDLARVNSDLEQFAYVASHDLQEPLRKISLFSDILMNRYSDGLNPTALSYLQRIISSAARMGTLIRNVLDFSKLHTREDDFEMVDLNTTLTAVQEDLELAIHDKNIQVKVNPLPRVRAIPLQMYQLFFNLVGNATKFTRADVQPVIFITKGEPVTRDLIRKLKLDTKQNYTSIVVKDNGIGFKQEFAEQIFAIFQRLNTREQFEGTGIGLALCRKIANEHGGEIYATSREGDGAEFHVVLPI